ncbi:carboxypeptidase-like regulatory domain-containing protein [Croceitalea rosinachiae]|uniref:Carboxypeptidase-like regulatory domain-containing protein n=1 Tax=Croceitalea rosinachiae TaxID=3075596 RepID=A0ABU3AGC8_9FLAO|nr:carboxypeptidase-like regulatory domain-containing protein [Croceitalea sp. F388]MDT0608612.1 carboxypeptidase-like regulatory domain-containing protein [Croceitalea sp. F388]
MKNNLFFLFLCLCFAASAQTFSNKSLKGRVIAEGKDVTGVAIQNITAKRATITDLNGNFSIKVKLNDTLVFSAVQFKQKVLPISKALIDSPFITVPLEEFVNELREVVVNPYNLSGLLDSDLSGLELEKDVSAEALGLPNAHQKIPTQSQRKLQQATFGKFNVGMILSPPLDPIINAITGRTKMLKNRVKVDKTYARTQRVQNFYVDSIFMVDLKIPQEKIADFMYFCEVDTAFQATVDTHDKLKIWEFLIQKSKAYRDNNELD